MSNTIALNILIVLLNLLLTSSRIGEDNSLDDLYPSSSIICIGAWNNCTTVGGELNCKLRFAVKPFQSTVCHIRNACIYKNEIELYDDSPQSRAFDGEELAMSPFAKKVELGRDGNVRIRVYPAKNMPSNHNDVFSIVPGVMIENVDNHNVGHIYGDEIWPAFQMLHRFGYNWNDFPFQLVLRKPPEIYKKQVHELISDYLPTHMQNPKRQCYSSIFVGSNAMSYSESSPDPNALLSFRNFLRTRANRVFGMVQNSTDGRSDRRKPNILMVAKDTKHSQHPTIYTNFEAAVQTVRESFPDLQVKTITSFHRMKQIEQIQTMWNTDIMYTQPGSDAMNAIFLPVGSSLVTPCRLLDISYLYANKVRSSAPEKTVIEYGNEVRIWFQAMPDMRCVQICGDEDIVFDKSQFMTPATLNISSLIKSLRGVVRDWKQDHNMYLQKRETPPVH